MKKFLLSLATLFTATALWAEPLVVDFSTAETLPTDDSLTGQSFTVGGVNFTADNVKKGSYSGETYLQISGKKYAGANLGFSLSVACENIVFHTGSNASTNVTVQLSANGENIGDAVKLNTKNADFRFEVPAAYQAAGTVYKFTVANTYNAQVTTLTFNAEGEPEPEPEPTVVNNIAEALVLCTEAGTPDVTINAPVTVVYKNGRYMWITDATGSMLTYNGADAEIPAYTSGDVIPAGITGTAVNYSSGLLQLKDLVASSFGTPTAGTPVAPIEVAVEEISVDLVSNFVVIPNVTIEASGSANNYNVTDATGTIALYNQFANASYYDVVDVPEGSNLMLYAMVSVRNGVAQLLPVKVVSASGKDVCSAPEFSPASCELLKGATVTITSATEGATIHYTIDGTEPTSTSTVYSEPIIVVFDVTIKAIAVKEGFENSDVATATYTIKEVAPIEGTTATFNFSDPTTLDPAYTLDDCTADGSNFKVEKAQFDFYANGVSLSTTASGNGARIYYQSASEAWSYRIYKNSVTTFTVAEGYTLTGITFETQTESYATALGKCTFTEGTTFADGYLSIPNLTSVTLTNPADGGATVGFTKIVVEFSDGSGISDITIDNAPAEYFNLQGVPVRGDLTPGLYIRRQGNTATKVLVK